MLAVDEAAQEHSGKKQFHICKLGHKRTQKWNNKPAMEGQSVIKFGRDQLRENIITGTVNHKHL